MSFVPAIAVVGCGAIAERLHLPALTRHSSVLSRAVLVDPNLDRADRLASTFGVQQTARSLREVMSTLDGVLVLTPHRLHHALVIEALGMDAHVFCEKPLAESAGEVAAICATSAAVGRHVLVNNARRLVPVFAEVRRLIAAGELGSLRRIEMTLGEVFDWPVAGDGYFGVRAGGRGVLADVGSHLVDLACWWAGAAVEVVRFSDDSYGGTEAWCEAVLAAGECEIVVRLDWLAKLRNGWRVVGTEAEAEGTMYDFREFTIRRNGRPVRRRLAGPADFAALGDAMMGNFLDVLRGSAAPLVTAADVLPGIALLEECYAKRERIPEPWHDAGARIAHV